jgi:hypothetical protein
MLAQPVMDCFAAFEESFNCFPGLNYELEGM